MLFDNPALLLVGFAAPLVLAALVLFGLYWVVRLAVGHGAADADRTLGGDTAGPPAGSDYGADG
ncbi:hypothetical protein SAMN06264364_10832 [Quadrisphaera granulorum]|uniref:Uncharacterized protein n=1 Tax=Quadrisphaera granulorum TaxID=317664 RepID=A0A316A8Q1_9ACTN|nr:hypothetical protein [Quadrisphaera granulorum]PWJ54125.1 hypothetical protein BXY45_10832 [Quadrisphaera granulorum]SZE96264.1 hypothetical protein SAMN06264364_10832 [Quadrisphaera granulorum]